MSEITVKIAEVKQVPVKYLKAECCVRYWEDATVNDVGDVNGDLIPCRIDDKWAPLIELATGRIEGWPKGTTAYVHYKVCDDGVYELIDQHHRMISRVEGYVIEMMCPKEEGYGDYVIMKVGANGQIANWKVDLSPFEAEEDD